MLQWFTSLATEVQLAVIGIFGTIVGAVAAVWRESKKPAEKSAPTLAIAGALIDSNKADEVVEAIEDQTRAATGQTEATEDQIKASRQLTAAMTANTTIAGRVLDELGEVRSDMRELKNGLDRAREELRIQREANRK